MDIFNIDGIITLLQGLYDALMGYIQGFADFVVNVPSFILALIYSFTDTIAFPIWAFNERFTAYVTDVVNIVMCPINTSHVLEARILEVYGQTIGLVVDGWLFGLMCAPIAAVVVLRVYSFVKDIEILGFKV